jgi:hypothetical protein
MRTIPVSRPPSHNAARNSGYTEVMATAFNGLQPVSGPFFLAPGASARINMWYGDPGDAMARNG